MSYIVVYTHIYVVYNCMCYRISICSILLFISMATILVWKFIFPCVICCSLINRLIRTTLRPLINILRTKKKYAFIAQFHPLECKKMANTRPKPIIYSVALNMESTHCVGASSNPYSVKHVHISLSFAYILNVQILH